MSKKTKSSKSKKSTVRHTRAVQRDRSKRLLAAPPAKEVAARLQEVILPAAQAEQERAHRDFGVRVRKLTLVVMLAFVLSLIWRQVGSISDGMRLLNTEGLLWATAIAVSQQALSLRLASLPAELFWRVLLRVLPVLHARWQARQRPLPPELAWARARYTQVVACDGSTLDALLRKTGLLREALVNPLAGRMTALLDLCSRLPCHVWYEPDPEANDQRFWERILAVLQAGSLLVFDLGYTNFQVFKRLTTARVTFITRAKCNLSFKVVRCLYRSANVRDLLVEVGSGPDRQLLRLVQVQYRGKWYRYLTNELDAERLPVAYVVALYWQRWRIEIVCTQMTKMSLLPCFAGWDHVPDLHLTVVNDNAVNEEFHQLSALVKSGLLQPLLDTLAERLNRSSYGCHFDLFFGLGFQLPQLSLQRFLLLSDLQALALQFRQGNDFSQVRFQKAFFLPCQLVQGLL